jgi:hypothetical protein
VDKDISIEIAGTDEKTFQEVFALCLGLYRDNAQAPLNAEKLARYTYVVLSEGMTFVARVDGKAVGMLGLVEVDYSYSDETFLKDAGFWVREDYRGGPGLFGTIGNQLMAWAAAEGEKRGKLVKIFFTNPDKAAKRRRRVIDGEMLGYVPVGYAMRFAAE